MELNEYQQEVHETAYFQADYNANYLGLALCGEAGEIANKLKKLWRVGASEPTDEEAREIALEIGDVMWYCSELATTLGYTLDDVAAMNIDKIHSRIARGTLEGDGDNR